MVGLFMLIPAAVSAVFAETEPVRVFLVTSCLTLILGGGLMYVYRSHHDSPLTTRDGFLLVTLSWFGVSALGALPYYFSGTFPSLVDAFFG